jgi:hypothetical protein
MLELQRHTLVDGLKVIIKTKDGQR